MPAFWKVGIFARRRKVGKCRRTYAGLNRLTGQTGSMDGVDERSVMNQAQRAVRYGWTFTRTAASRLPRRWHAARSAGRPPDARSDTIALVTRRVTAREVKIGHALRASGWRTVLLAKTPQPTGGETDAFDQVAAFTDYADILRLLDEVGAAAVHLFAHGDNLFYLPLGLLAPCPLVYDPYDVWQGMFRTPRAARFYRLELRAERWFCEHASRLCARSLEPLLLKRRFGYRLAPSIYFPEYCLHPPRPATSPGPEIHIVYCGGVWPEDRYPAATHGYAQYLEVARRLAAQQLHLHIYPANRGDGVPFAEFFAAYRAEAQANPYFHFHEPLPYAGLMAALPTYDFAMHIFGPGIDTQTGQNSPDKLRYSSANKLFDYIEAGLPVIMHSGFHQRGLVRHYGRAIVIDTLDGLAERLHVAGRAPFPRRASVTLAYQAPRLGRFYRELLCA